MHKIIPVAGPSITDREISYVMDAIENGWYAHANDYVEKFENTFKATLGRTYAISLPSCTSGLHLSLLALGIGPGDEVIVPDATWIASAAPISYVGATPIFADMDPETWCLSTASVQKLVSPRTKAIIAVNLYGNMPDYEGLAALGIPIIEDTAESIGSTYQGKKSGTFGLTSCFSFHGSKTMTTGEGGMLVTDSKEIYDQCMMLRDHGRLPGDVTFQNIQVGHKYKMSNLQAALGLAQIERIDELVKKKRDIFAWYASALSEIPGLTLNPDIMGVENSYWMTTMIWDRSFNLHKLDVMQSLKERGIDSRPFFSPLSSLKAYEAAQDATRAKQENLISYDICGRGLNLPSGAHLTESCIDKITAVLKIIFQSP